MNNPIWASKTEGTQFLSFGSDSCAERCRIFPKTDKQFFKSYIGRIYACPKKSTTGGQTGFLPEASKQPDFRSPDIKTGRERSGVSTELLLKKARLSAPSNKRRLLGSSSIQVLADSLESRTDISRPVRSEIPSKQVPVATLKILGHLETGALLPPGEDFSPTGAAEG